MQIARDAVADSLFALRSFRRAPGWTFVTLVTIALGVGASTAVFSVADTYLIRPLAYRDASHVYAASMQGNLDGESITLPISAAVVGEWRRSARTIDAAAPYGTGPLAYLRNDTGDVSVTTVAVDTAFLGFTGARPLIGRNFLAGETVPNGPRAIILAEGFWRRQYGGSPAVLGKVVRLDLSTDPDPRPRTIVGVMPASVFLPDFTSARPDVWLPLVDGQQPRISGVAVRLTAGASATAANEELTSIVRRPDAFDPTDEALHPRVQLSRPQDELPFRQALLVLAGAVILLLLIACSNVSHLLLQRGVARERELAVRHALGADRGRLVRHLVTESALLGVAGGALAILVGWFTLLVLVRLRPATTPALSYLSTTRGVIPFAAALAIVVGLTVGVLGALHIAHRQLGESLRVGASSAPMAHRTLRGTLVVGQIALSAILLAGAILLIRVVYDLEREPLGFDSRGLYAVSFRAVDQQPTPEALAAFASTVRSAAEHAVGSRSLTIANAMPSRMAFASAFETRERPGAVGPQGFTGVAYVAPDYFSITHMPLLAGRAFDDGSLSRNEVVVSRSLARQLWHDVDVVGRQLRNSRREGALQQWQTVVGVAPDILTNRLDRGVKPMLYRPFPGNAVETTLIVRSTRADAADILRRFARSVQPNPFKSAVTNVNEKMEQSMAEPRFTMSVLVLFAVSGVLLAAIGLFGVLSYTLGLRTREIGVRITLGATRRDIAGLVVRDALAQAAVGIALGLVGAAALARLIQASLYGVRSFDATTMGLAAVSMLLVSLTACARPLFRATRVDPVVAMRVE